MQHLDQGLYDRLSAQAKISPRRRHHFNLHETLQDASQRLLIAMEPGSYLRPHRHFYAAKPECFIALRGRFGFFQFDDQGGIVKFILLGNNDDSVGLNIPPGLWHTLISLQQGSILFETKPGPYTPISEKDLAPWSPAEGSEDVSAYMSFLLNQVAIMRIERS